jgi:ZIP Zinc transporter
MSSHRRRVVSPLQSKGIAILWLVLLTESVTLTKAVRLWSTVQSFDGGRGTDDALKKQPQHPPTSEHASSSWCRALPHASCGDPSASSSSLSSSPPAMKRTLGNISRRIASLGRRRDHQSNQPHPNPRSGGGGGFPDCCQQFIDCASDYASAGASSSSSAAEELPCTLVPRGGHLHHAAAAAGDVLVGASKLPYNIPLNGWKVIFQALLTTLNVVCWLVPLRSKQISENKLALSLANAFSGGVFLSLAFGHLIPECVHGFEGLAATNEVTPYLLVLSGYLLIFFVEKVAFDAHEILHEMQHHPQHGHGTAATSTTTAKPTENGNATEDGSVGAATSGRSALILLGALAVHSILEMAALGLADTFTDSAILTLSIALHQVRPPVCAFDPLHFCPRPVHLSRPAVPRPLNF